MNKAFGWLKACLPLVMALVFLILMIGVVLYSTFGHAPRHNEKGWRADCLTSTWVVQRGLHYETVWPMSQKDIALYC